MVVVVVVEALARYWYGKACERGNLIADLVVGVGVGGARTCVRAYVRVQSVGV